MTIAEPTDSKRKRAPSKRSLATRKRVFDAAEKVFADRGFDGATIRDIATEAGEPVGSVHHHGGGKEALFHRTVARRAAPLSRTRLKALQRLRDDRTLTVETLLSAFIRPFFDLSGEDSSWRDYARLVAFASADDRWQTISQECFDPTAEVFLSEIIKLVPGISRHEAAEGFVFCVSAMLALLTSQGRIGALGGVATTEDRQIQHLIRFCAAGLATRS
ncbi:TetR family transcriptional regulator [Thalassovita gelatinovora]|uniref:TetR family transcriptional regulator n=1 Tax=Thalassovita gelatinovora TaxID=53501 RepID=A0A0P1FGX3_THAGE|nr:TetR/AcrR family transcriptional regulator [Thalassovita gelatinovora]QIZ81930.1 TetR/AcrR family transcriptional regulator [Thalassovita gelatinovora]CUH67307.1 TetR family transcriptional regulator [Thalassovita gelatinovora]SEP76524.1 transcriptional regulator, TetR family [Thalassovita gelatinovora]